MRANSLEKFADTIAAISTALGPGGVGIVRLSGGQSLSIADKIFVIKNGTRPSECKTFTVHYGHVLDSRLKTAEDDGIVDEALLTVMREPKSYTCEDIVEISCHGGYAAQRAILELMINEGARLAEPGEFTKRAFLKGRIDLTQAEAVLDIVQARTEAFLRVSTHQLKGDLTRELEDIREKLMHSYSQLEAIVNFPEDDVEQNNSKTIRADIEKANKQIKQLLLSSEQGRILRDGIKVVICGKVNVGKSSLLNVLLKHPRAIVSDIEGTTRDTIEEAAQVQGIPLQLVDTAGILEPRDHIEEEAIKRSHMNIESADVVLFLLDTSREIAKEDEELFERIKSKSFLTVLNKCDLPHKIAADDVKAAFPGGKIVSISALRGEGIKDLEEKIIAHALHGQAISSQGILISNLRHVQSLRNAQAVAQRIIDEFNEKLSFEFVAEEIKQAIKNLDEITGRNIDSDLLDQIFSQFCIGK
ncbi:MAG: tRNA uridine-5-carboxymethylaminomethyl(34) synthesis GTPase MnmE [Candidatus Omnitrophica bacterium]|nr:tRNA uridine-5-carboxymethylaminomethyl(34) synthesis GTPase MnmE [Candidatus Omnitrophota bacterium]